MPRSSHRNPNYDDHDDEEEDRWNDDEMGDGDDDDLPDGVYHDDEEDAYTIPCPYCKAPIHEDAQYCPKCENYISQEDRPAEKKPLWIWMMLLLTLALALTWIV